MNTATTPIEPLLDQLAGLVSESRDVGTLVRPLLEMLEMVTGMESTYFTTINFAANTQQIVFSHNSRDLMIPEGLEVCWDDTLCKRALEENTSFTDNVPERWGDSEAAQAMGIHSYLSEPVRVGHGEVYGTLCAASSARQDITPEAGRLIRMFAQLIASQLEQEHLLTQLREQNIAFSKYALTDPLTGIPNRRALMEELARMLARADRDGSAVHVALIDLDNFKAINDEYGHDAGDRFLIQVANRFSGVSRGGDLVARYGGDEFVMVAPACSSDDDFGRHAIARRLSGLLVGSYFLDTMTLDYRGASVGVVTSIPGERDLDGLLARADAAMYSDKKQRRRMS